MEFIDIVDKNGNYTGQTMEREEAHDKNLLHHEVSVFVLNANNEVLLQKRSPNKRLSPNQWGLCSGHVHAGEKIDCAALRELKEEIGLRFSLGDIHKFGLVEVHIADTNSYIKHSYYVKTASNLEDMTIQEEEITEVRWFPINTLIRRILDDDETITLKKNRLYLLEILKELEP